MILCLKSAHPGSSVLPAKNKRTLLCQGIKLSLVLEAVLGERLDSQSPGVLLSHAQSLKLCHPCIEVAVFAEL